MILLLCDLSHIFTVRNEVAKVMFFTCVCPHGRGCLPQCMLGYHPPGADPEQTSPEQTPPRADTPPERRPLLRTVRILLECILVIKRTYLFCLIELFMNLNDHIFCIYHKIKNSIFTCNYMLNIARVVRTSIRTASLKIRFQREFLQAKSDYRYNYSRKKQIKKKLRCFIKI